MSLLEYELPESAIAQRPAEPRDSSRLLVLNKQTSDVAHKRFTDLTEYLREGDLVVLNNTRVSAVRLFGEKESGGKVEALLLRELEPLQYEALVKPARRLQPGARIDFGAGVSAIVESKAESGGRILSFEPVANFDSRLRELGKMPLPPYVHEELEHSERYQTVYSKTPGSSAAPTAGLHFTPELLAKVSSKGIETAEVTLDVGIDTFRPITCPIAEHKMHGERYFIPDETAHAVRNAKGRILAVGTTSVRALESAAIGVRQVKPGSSCTSLFIKPGYELKIADAILTNFHMPKTTMLLLVSAFCGIEPLMRAYEEALATGYRFLSFGDSMLIIGDE